jgi:hypothetical protein
MAIFSAAKAELIVIASSLRIHIISVQPRL